MSPNLRPSSSQGTRSCGAGGVLCNAPLVQNKSYWEAKIQSLGTWGVGVATRQSKLDTAPLGTAPQAFRRVVFVVVVVVVGRRRHLARCVCETHEREHRHGSSFLQCAMHSSMGRTLAARTATYSSTPPPLP